jgi:hypothetical protein
MLQCLSYSCRSLSRLSCSCLRKIAAQIAIRPTKVARLPLPESFGDLASGFQRLARSQSSGNDTPLGLGVKRPPLAVHNVGGLEASFVPRLCDFERLDARFRISSNIWDSLPVYRDYGFAVFKLRPSDGPTDTGRHADHATSIRRVHPMALVGAK